MNSAYLRMALVIIEAIPLAPSNGMELTGLRRHVPCEREEHGPRRSSHAAHVRC